MRAILVIGIISVPHALGITFWLSSVCMVGAVGEIEAAWQGSRVWVMYFRWAQVVSAAFVALHVVRAALR
jgi:hypothetical protein